MLLVVLKVNDVISWILHVTTSADTLSIFTFVNLMHNPFNYRDRKSQDSILKFQL